MKKKKVDDDQRQDITTHLQYVKPLMLEALQHPTHSERVPGTFTSSLVKGKRTTGALLSPTYKAGTLPYLVSVEAKEPLKSCHKKKRKKSFHHWNVNGMEIMQHYLGMCSFMLNQ